jgi:hypothetical protein
LEGIYSGNDEALINRTVDPETKSIKHQGFKTKHLYERDLVPYNQFPYLMKIGFTRFLRISVPELIKINAGRQVI